jgi:hypothetical protein
MHGSVENVGVEFLGIDEAHILEDEWVGRVGMSGRRLSSYNNVISFSSTHSGPKTTARLPAEQTTARFEMDRTSAIMSHLFW